jgi:hypothetical protein
VGNTLPTAQMHCDGRANHLEKGLQHLIFSKCSPEPEMPAISAGFFVMGTLVLQAGTVTLRVATLE